MNTGRSWTIDRLRKRAQFLAVKKGKFRRGQFIHVEFRDRNDTLPPRIGYTVTKKQGNAVERNRMKRRMREGIRTAVGPRLKKGRDYVFIAQRRLMSARFEDMVAEMCRLVDGGSRKNATKEAILNGQ